MIDILDTYTNVWCSVMDNIHQPLKFLLKLQQYLQNAAFYNNGLGQDEDFSEQKQKVWWLGRQLFGNLVHNYFEIVIILKYNYFYNENSV